MNVGSVVLLNRHEHLAAWFVACLVSFSLISGVRPVHAADLTIESVTPQWQENVYQLDARIHYNLNAPALEALRKGVAIVMVLDVEVFQQSPWYWPEKTIASLEQRYQIKYHALTERYLLTNLNTGVQSGFPSLQSALDVLGGVMGLPVLDRQLLEEGTAYAARMRARLDLDALPAPVRLLAYVTPGWRQSSDWYEWKLAH